MTFFYNSFVLICVYLCLVRPLNKQRRRQMFRACTASTAAFIASSYMHRMETNVVAAEQPKSDDKIEEAEEEDVFALWHPVKLPRNSPAAGKWPMSSLHPFSNSLGMDVILVFTNCLKHWFSKANIYRIQAIHSRYIEYSVSLTFWYLEEKILLPWPFL